MTLLTRCTAAAVLAGAATGALAQATVSMNAQATGFSYVLTDLAPDDGIAPTLTWTRRISQTNVGSSVQTPGTAPWPTFQSIESSLQKYESWADTTAQTAHAQVALSPTNLSTSFDVGYAGGTADASVLVGGYFTLSANTSVTFSAQASLSGSGNVAPGAPPLVGSDWVVFTGRAGIVLGRLVGGNNTLPWDAVPWSSTYEIYEDAFVDESVGPLTPGGSISASQQITVTFNNTTAADKSLNVGLSIGTYGYSVSTAPVPEPGTWLLCAIGLGAAGWAARQRTGRVAA